jgi:hypothetical protein
MAPCARQVPCSTALWQLALWFRAQGFNCEELLYYDYGSLDEETEQRLKCRRADLEELVR